ncbi:hypothetical protein MG293_002191 [Ovis ammon polii]|uniref:Uncharacterized protein n=1 Tax=Ovis ammon polii TaxID=230172 RepID=A0AAD4UPA6_OVIAM|nr:hypothetical protein MG293_002191 [Ovis ammon polii]
MMARQPGSPEATLGSSGGRSSKVVAQTVERLFALQETWAQSLGQEDSLEEKMVTQFNTVAWKIPWMEEPAYQRLATSLNKTQQQSDKSGSTDPKEQVNLNERSWNLWGPCVLVLSPASQPRRSRKTRETETRADQGQPGYKTRTLATACSGGPGP